MDSEKPKKRRSRAGHLWRVVRFWFLINMGSYLIIALARLHAATLRLNWEGQEHFDLETRRNVIFAIWHSDMVTFYFLSLVLGRERISNTVLLASMSRDGLLNKKIMELIGFRVVQGSPSKRAAAALVAFRKELREGHNIGMTIDGPRGPNHEAKPGTAFLSKNSGVPVVAFTVTPSRRWAMSDWCRTEIPKPFARLDIRVAPPRVLDDIDEGTAWLTQVLRERKPA